MSRASELLEMSRTPAATLRKSGHKMITLKVDHHISILDLATAVDKYYQKNQKYPKKLELIDFFKEGLIDKGVIYVEYNDDEHDFEESLKIAKTLFPELS